MGYERHDSVFEDDPEVTSRFPTQPQPKAEPFENSRVPPMAATRGPAAPSYDSYGATQTSLSGGIIEREIEEHAELQMIWDEEMNHRYKFVRHEKIAVLLLSWHPKHNDLNTSEEVRGSIMNYSTI